MSNAYLGSIVTLANQEIIKYSFQITPVQFQIVIAVSEQCILYSCSPPERWGVLLPKLEMSYGVVHRPASQTRGRDVFFAHPSTSWERRRMDTTTDYSVRLSPGALLGRVYSVSCRCTERTPQEKTGHATPEELFDLFLDRVYAADSKHA